MRVITIGALLFVLILGVFFGVLSATGTDKADMEGNILGVCQTNSSGENGTPNSVLVEGIMDGSHKNQNVSVKITKDTVIVYKKPNNSKASLNDLKKGQNVEVYFTGPIMETYPPQTIANQIVILG